MHNHSNEESLTTIFTFSSFSRGTYNQLLNKITYQTPQFAFSTCKHSTEPVPHWEFDINFDKSFIVDIEEVFGRKNKITGNVDSTIFEGTLRGNGSPMSISCDFGENRNIVIANLKTGEIIKLSGN